jgi:hypothetical protein
MRAIPDQRVNVRIRYLIVDTRAVRTAEALGGNAFRCATSAFHVTPGCHGWAGRSVVSRKRLDRRQAGQSSGVRGLSSRVSGAATVRD